LEPHISQETLQYHYAKHHQGYVTKLNALLLDHPHDTQSLEDLIQTTTHLGIFNNAAQIWNHSFYWESLCPQGRALDPNHALSQAIDTMFGSLAQFRTTFLSTALGIFGSGWAWLIQNAEGHLAITTTSNADTPIKRQERPLLVCDVWEHAYYIDYRNDRAQHLEAFWQLIDWERVSKRFPC
jgi:Fe-Mn family superoxide dismutase